MFLIAGLGNPGLKYRHTRHNTGFDCLDHFAEEYGIRIHKKEKEGLTGRGRAAGQDVLLVKPQTYMNLSGACIGPLLQYYHLDPEKDLIVLSDDIMLDAGMIRIRPKGSAGGHNGLKSIIAFTGTEDFMRIRIGAGKLPEGGDMVKHVLGHLPREERKKQEEAFAHAGDALLLLMDGKIDEAMNRYNRKA